MKRYLSLFLAAAVLISCLTITAFADDGREENANAFNGSFADMLTATDYTFYKDETFVTTSNIPTTRMDPKGSKYQISWYPNSAGSIIGVNFCLYTGVEPTSVQFLRDDGLANNCQLVKSIGSYRYYTWTNTNEVPFQYDHVSVIANYGASQSVNFGLINFYGILPDSHKVTSVIHSTSYETIRNGSSFVLPMKDAVTTSFPFNYNHLDHEPFYQIDTLKIDIPGSNLNSFSVCFTTLGAVTFNEGVSCGLYKNGSLVCMLPVELFTGYGGSLVLQGDTKGLSYTYTANIDLSGLDLTGCQLYFKTEVDAWESASDYYTKVYFHAAAFKLNAYVMPWYKEFFHWISGVMTAGYQSIVDAIKGDSNTEMNEATDQMEGAANDLKESSNAFEQVETPDIDAGALTGDLTNFSVSGLAVLGVITANPYVTSLLVLVFTFALCAYIFFGKKG